MDPNKNVMTVPMLAHIRRVRDDSGLWIVIEVVDNTTLAQRAAIGFPKVYDVLDCDRIQSLRAAGCKFLIRGRKP